jgi:hypothetical protein
MNYRQGGWTPDVLLLHDSALPFQQWTSLTKPPDQDSETALVHGECAPTMWKSNATTVVLQRLLTFFSTRDSAQLTQLNT